MVKNLPASAGDSVQSLGREDSLKKEVATCSRTLAWRNTWTEEPGGLSAQGRKRAGQGSAAKQAKESIYSVVLTSGVQQGMSTVHLSVSESFSIHVTAEY